MVVDVKESVSFGSFSAMTDAVALEPSDLQTTPRVGEKVGETKLTCIAEVSSLKHGKNIEEFLNIEFTNSSQVEAEAQDSLSMATGNEILQG